MICVSMHALACRERETVEAERRGDLGRDVMGLDLDDFGTDQRIQGLIEDGDEITYVLRPDTQQAAQQAPATIVVIQRQSGETLDAAPGSTVEKGPMQGQHDGQPQPSVCRFEVGDPQTAPCGESKTNGEANGSADRVRDVELGDRAAERVREGRGTGGVGSLNLAAPGQGHGGSEKVGCLLVCKQSAWPSEVWEFIFPDGLRLAFLAWCSL